MAMHFLIGFRTDDYVVLAADKSAFAHGAIIVSQEHEKIVKLGGKQFMSVTGEDGDVPNFVDWVQRNLSLYKMRNGYELSPASTHFWLRKNIADNLRSRNFWRVEVLLAGFDDIEGKTWLSSIDYLGNGIENQNYLFRGFSGRFCYALLDTIYRPDLPIEQGIEAVKKCVAEAKKRFISNLSNFDLIVITREGVQRTENVVPA